MAVRTSVGLLFLSMESVSSDVAHAACKDDRCTATHGSLFIQHQGVVTQASNLSTAQEASGACDESGWPDKDHGRICGDCKVLVDRFSTFYKTCDGYCKSLGRECTGAWEEVNDDCNVKHDMQCDQELASTDAICECSAAVSQGGSCYGEMSALAQDEGSGVATIWTNSIDKCKDACSANSNCQSVSFCPQWSGCWLKDRALTGNEATKQNGECRTHYKQTCGNGSPTVQSTTPTPPSSHGNGDNRIKVVSYNLFWWNAFRQNSWKSNDIVDNIKHRLGADVLGLQECDDPTEIQRRTGYEPASDFAGAQGIVVKPGEFRIGSKGHQDIKATGKWGPRYVTWVELTHKNGRKFFHFNTHWCVHSGNGRTCTADTRFEGAKNMLKVIQETTKGAPAVITGDFNAGMSEPGIRHFEQNGFDRVVDAWVDAIFVSKGHWSVSSTGVGDRANSDHQPVYAELLF